MRGRNHGRRQLRFEERHGDPNCWSCEREARPGRGRHWEPGQVCGTQNQAREISCRQCHYVKRPHQFRPEELRGDTLLGTASPDHVLKHLTYAQVASDENLCRHILAQNDEGFGAGAMEGFRQYLLSQQRGPPHNEDTVACCAAEEVEEEQGLDDMLERRDVQRCGHCGAPTIRNGGCSQMTCTQCNHQWRWDVTARPVIAQPRPAVVVRHGMGLWARPDTLSYEEAIAIQDQLGGIPNGLTPSAIDQIPIVPVVGECVCAVCMEDLEEGVGVRRLPCEHWFHPRCIDPWLAMKPTCPLCQFRLPRE